MKPPARRMAESLPRETRTTRTIDSAMGMDERSQGRESVKSILQRGAGNRILRVPGIRPLVGPLSSRSSDAASPFATISQSSSFVSLASTGSSRNGSDAPSMINVQARESAFFGASNASQLPVGSDAALRKRPRPVKCSCGHTHMCSAPQNLELDRHLAASPGPSWRKILYEPQPFPDNHTGEEFLATLVTNGNLSHWSVWSTMLESAGITQRISIVLLVVLVFVHLLAATDNRQTRRTVGGHSPINFIIFHIFAPLPICRDDFINFLWLHGASLLCFIRMTRNKI